MHIKEVISRHRNDFAFIAECPHCAYTHKRYDGYADAHFQLRVLPSQACEECGLNEAGETEDEQQARWASSAASPSSAPTTA